MTPQAEREELEKGLERKSLTARGVHAALLAEGKTEVDRPWRALAWSGLASGISMGLSLLAEGVLHASLPEAGWRPLVSNLGYTFGFIVVILGRQQLYTETTLTAFLPLLHDRSRHMVQRVVRLWIVVLAANLLGSLFVAWGLSHPSVTSIPLREAFAAVASEASHHAPWDAFIRGILGGWIIALTVWLLPSAEAARLWVIILMTWLIAAAELTHIVAGSLEYFYGIFIDQSTWTGYFTRYFLPVLVGNSIGGIVFVAALNHAQSVTGERRITGI